MICAIIVNYYTKSLLPPLLNDLISTPLISQIIIVDNSSELGSFPFHSDKINVIINSENKGFGAAVNQAADMAGEKWLLLVNPDVRLDNGCVQTLLDAAGQYCAPIVCPRFYWDDNHAFRLPPATGMSLWFNLAHICAGKYQLDAQTFSFYWILRHERYWEAVSPFAEPFVAGACLLIDKSWVLAKTKKIFDENFFVYFEDTDLCVRALYDNAVVLCVPNAKAVHYYDQSPSVDKSKNILMSESFEAFQNKYYKDMSFQVLGNESYAPEMTDLGELSAPPMFHHEATQIPETYFFEIGINPFFVPFIQADVKEETFYFPNDIWQRLGPGQYFTRIRGKISGVRNVWTWKK